MTIEKCYKNKFLNYDQAMLLLLTTKDREYVIKQETC